MQKQCGLLPLPLVKVKEAKPNSNKKKTLTLEERVRLIVRKKAGKIAKPIAASLNVGKTQLAYNAFTFRLRFTYRFYFRNVEIL